MSDWSRITLCGDCGAGNPDDGEHCVNCGVNLREAKARSEALRAETQTRLAANRHPKGTPLYKPVNELTLANLKRYPVWKFDFSNEGKYGRDETWAKPVKKLPVTDLSNCIIGTPVKFANGVKVFAQLGNIDLQHPRKTQQFLVIDLHIADDDWFSLARYFDVDFTRREPEALARYIDIPLGDIFPITYDISKLARGIEAVIKGTIPLEPAEKLTDGQRMDLIFNRLP